MEKRIVKIITPGTTYFFEEQVGDGVSGKEVIEHVLNRIDNRTMMLWVKDPWILTERQVLTCPACNGKIEAADLQRAPICPNCNSVVVDVQTGQPLELGGRKLQVVNARVAISLTYVSEASDEVVVSVRNATIMAVDKDSNIAKMIEQGKIDLVREKEEAALAESGLVVANNLKAVDQAATMAKKAQEGLKKGFIPKLV